VAERERRIGRNEALFREVNERIQRVSQALEVANDNLRILCECGDASCFEHLDVSLPDYERVRAEPSFFFVRTGHERLNVEEVVEEQERYLVVRKTDGHAVAEARELNP
jgi:hypothetical protein